MTIRCRDEAELWLGTSSLWLDDQPYEVEEQRGYKDRWVVKLAGIDDANDAAQLRGATVTVEREAAPQLGDFEHWHEDLVDLEVVLVDGSKVGRVRAAHPPERAFSHAASSSAVCGLFGGVSSSRSSR